MTLIGLRILPPFAIGRLGSAEKPLVNYTLADDPERPLESRTLQAAETLEVDEATGEILRSRLPSTITFKDEQERIRPVAPFLEVFAETREHGLVPLTTAALRTLGISPAALSWRVEMGNRKVARRTGDAKDSVQADTGWFSGHAPVELHGHCPNFVSREAFIRFGRVRFIRPNADFPEIRMRFTPAQGLIYGPKLTAEQWARDKAEGSKSVDNLYQIPEERAVYDPRKGRWYRFEVPEGIDNADPDYKGPFVSETLPPSLFAIQPPAPCWLNRNVAISRGYFDDACDGVVTVRLQLGPRRRLEARARITSAPPMVIPDTLFLRSLADDLDQVIHGPAVPPSEPPEITRARAMDIVRRAFDTVRFLNVAVMNGNPVQGRDPLLFDTMPAEEAFDTGRLMRPVVPERTADTLMIQALHQQVFTALRSGTAPWFGRMLRMPDQVTDFTDHGRRKMPAMMCGADGSYLALTWRQIRTIFAASSLPPGPAAALHESLPGGDALWPEPEGTAPALTPRNLSAQLHYAAAGNPASSRPVSSIANCTPGLEVDFRAVWRRMFKGLVLREWDNLVLEVEPGATDAAGRSLAGLRGCRLLRVDGRLMMAQMLGPSPADTQGQSVVLSSDANPFGVAPLEWSNGLAHTLQDKQGGTAQCDFTRKPVWLDQ
ncbi:MAG: hypothetical protein J0L84_18440, partial [Verrucomicrobia bacterium]|nr:hypothetical protein [Verrucomicrobiota bacterium]